MNCSARLEDEITGILRAHGELSVAFITRFLRERGLNCTRQGVERTLRRMAKEGSVEVSRTEGNCRNHYRLR
ncbi:hypothetical protein [Thermococcus sp.]|uniref:hypothetical protein n=1 Tax=Thermococcus sp. TaxID=35749 RepID=UPI00262297A5|nr:hypothetical protein [Thermococcus sp.]